MAEQIGHMIRITPELFPDPTWLFKFLKDVNGSVTRRVDSQFAPGRAAPGAFTDMNYVWGTCNIEFFTQWCEKEGLLFLNLYPDMSRKAYTGNDTFIFAAPIGANSWLLLHKRAVRQTTENVKYLLPNDIAGIEDVIILLRERSHTDEDMLTAAAFIRMIHKSTERIYAVDGKTMSQAEIINRAMGAPRSLCKMLTVEEDDPKEE